MSKLWREKRERRGEYALQELNRASAAGTTGGSMEGKSKGSTERERWGLR